MRVIVFTLAIGLLMFSCNADNSETNNEAVNDTTSTNIIQEQSTAVVAEADTTKLNSEEATTDKKNTEATTQQTGQKAKDIDKEIKTTINKSKNPDNQNGNYDPSSIKSNITLIPVISDNEKANYFVQVMESPNKYSKTYFDTFFKTPTDVYVISEGGVFKYCVGKFKTMPEAESYMKEIKSKYKFKKLSVETYSTGW